MVEMVEVVEVVEMAEVVEVVKGISMKVESLVIQNMVAGLTRQMIGCPPHHDVMPRF